MSVLTPTKHGETDEGYPAIVRCWKCGLTQRQERIQQCKHCGWKCNIVRSITRVVNVRYMTEERRIAALADPNFLYVGRAYTGWPRSQWGNPVRVRRGQFITFDPRIHCRRPEKTMERYEEWVREKIRLFPGKFNPEELRGKKLGCWCGFYPENPNLQCHAVILARLAEELG